MLCQRPSCSSRRHGCKQSVGSMPSLDGYRHASEKKEEEEKKKEKTLVPRGDNALASSPPLIFYIYFSLNTSSHNQNQIRSDQ